MRVEFDQESDVVFIHLIEDPGHTRGRRLDERRIVHYDDNNTPVAVELLFVSNGIDIEGLPQAEEIAETLRAFPRLVA